MTDDEPHRATSLSVRRAQIADAEAVRLLVLEAYESYPRELGLRPAPMDSDYVEEIIEKDVWLAPAAGLLSGVIVMRRERGHLFVDNLAVLPSAQGAGLGEALLDFAYSRATELGLPELRLLTHRLMTRNRAYYERLGWQPMGTPTDEHLGRVYFRMAVVA